MQPWHDNTRFDLALKRGVASVVILGAFASTILYMSAILATETEAKEFAEKVMAEHIEEVKNTPYAMKADINLIINMMVQEKIQDAQNDVQEIDDKVIDGTASPSDLKKRSRLLKDIANYEKEKVGDGR